MYQTLDDQRAWNSSQLERFLNPDMRTKRRYNDDDEEQQEEEEEASFQLKLGQDIWIEIEMDLPRWREVERESMVSRKASLASLVCEETVFSPLL